MNDAPWLTITTFLPVVGVVVLFAVPNILPKVARGVALVTSLATFAVSLVVLSRFEAGAAGFQLVEDATWVFLLQQVDIYASRDRVTWTPRADQWMPLHEATLK